MNEAFDSLAGRRVILIGGKGGVGKTTISIAVALRLRAAVLFTTDPASSLADILHGELRTEALDTPALYRGFLDRNLEQFLEIGDRGTYLDKEELRRFFELSLPGADELMAWMRIGELAEENPTSTIVVDTAPTGHTLRMLGAAEHFRQFASALDSMQAKHRDLVRQFTRRSVRDAVDAFIADFDAVARRRRELLVTSGAFVPVYLSEPWVVEQTKRLIAAVDLDVPFAVLNRVTGSERDAAARAALAPLRVVEVPEWTSGREGLRAARAPRPLATLGVTKVLFFAGKGGVGKTTCSASVALQLAKTEKVTLLSVDPAHSVRDVFANQKPPDNLTVEAIDTRAKWRQFREALGEEIERAVGALTPAGVTVAHDTEAMRKLLEIAPPGADELFAITRLADLIAEGRRIVVDTAPTGHFLRLIDLPKTAGEWVHELMRILLRYRELIPPGTLGEELLRASRALHSVEETLRSDRCRIVVVTRPERIVVAETKRLLAEIERRGLHLGGVIANYVDGNLDALGDLGPVTIIERRDHPVVALEELATLVPVDKKER